MNSPRTFFLLLVALLVFCFGVAAELQPWFQVLESRRHQSDNFFSLLLGDSSRMFANSFFVKADEYYHSGYYPTIFDNNEAFKTTHMAEDTGAVSSKNQGEETAFMGEPRDWLDAFGRHSQPPHTPGRRRGSWRLERQRRSAGDFTMAQAFHRTGSTKCPELYRHGLLVAPADA
jgi:hypothetical protein